jgi:hypothetical protein
LASLLVFNQPTGGTEMAFDLRFASHAQCEEEAKVWAKEMAFGKAPLLLEILLLRQENLGLRQDIAALTGRLEQIASNLPIATLVPEPKPEQFVRECAARTSIPSRG